MLWYKPDTHGRNSGNEQFPKVELPVKYLGLPLLSTRLSHIDCLPLVKKVSSRIQGWREKFISYAGWLHLVNAELNGLSIYWVACFMLSMRTIYEVKRLCMNFLWIGADCTTSHALDRLGIYVFFV